MRDTHDPHGVLAVIGLCLGVDERSQAVGGLVSDGGKCAREEARALAQRRWRGCCDILLLRRPGLLATVA